MEQSQQLTRLIEKAMDNDWRDPYELYRLFSWNIQGVDGELQMVFQNERSFSQNDLLFGDNLSFLKALFPSREDYEVPYHFYRAEQLVIQDDSKRIPWLYSQVFGGQDD